MRVLRPIGDKVAFENEIPHELLNCRDWQHRNILIEIKATAPGEMVRATRPAS